MPAPATDATNFAALMQAQIDALKAQTAAHEVQTAAQLKALGRVKVSYGDYPAANPEGNPLKPAFQNGREVNPSGLSDDTIKKLSLIQPGRYLGGLITVNQTASGGVHFKYKSTTPDERMNFTMAVHSFSDMVAKISAEMASQTVEQK